MAPRACAPVGTASPAERNASACERLREEPGLVDLPARLSVFGPTRMTTEQLQVLAALAEHRDVHLWLPHPSARPVGARGSNANARRSGAPSGPRRPTCRPIRCCGRAAGMPASCRCGSPRSGRACAISDEWTRQARPPPPGALGRPGNPARPTAARHPGGPGAGGRAGRRRRSSVQVHACHGRQRQVEVLREVLLGLLDDDPTLEPRDVIVMCPDIEAFAPLIAAAFGLAEDRRRRRSHPGHELRVRLADRSLRQTNPVLTVVARLLELADARVTATEVLDLAAMPPVRHRFGLDDDALEQVGDWVRRSGVRWGLDAEARAPYRPRRRRPEHLAGGPRPAAGRGRDGRGRAPAPSATRAAARRRRRATTSTWPVGSPSWSTGSRPRSQSLTAGAAADRVGRRARARRSADLTDGAAARRLAGQRRRAASSPTRWSRRVTRGRHGGLGLSDVARAAGGAAARAGRRGRTSAPAT